MYIPSIACFACGLMMFIIYMLLNHINFEKQSLHLKKVNNLILILSLLWVMLGIYTGISIYMQIHL